jgi:hypothetical protein
MLACLSFEALGFEEEMVNGGLSLMANILD